VLRTHIVFILDRLAADHAGHTGRIDVPPHQALL
jgi:hypothetical protein